MEYLWLIPILPGIGAAVNGLVGIRVFSKRVSGLLACATMGLALAFSLVAFFELLALAPEARDYTYTIATWIPPMALPGGHGMAALEVPWTLRLDPLSGMMILVVTGVGFLIHVYSIGYMAEEPRGAFARYFSYLNLFCFFMLTLVLGANFLVLFVGWEGVGLCSYLLIGYWYKKKSASDAGKKAFIVNRIGDWGFLLGVFLVFFTFGTFDFRAVANAAAAMPTETTQFGVLSLITLLLFVGACGKSAQIPLYVWLPDAMEGPTPVSALIHAATMVTAGVYMVGRNAALFSQAPMSMEIVAVVGVLTALMAASIGLVQKDIKRVLAYSTVSQLGYMFLAMGVGAYAAGAFHLMTHAFFKALLFLSSGAVIHAMAVEQNMLHMGGLKKYLPVTYTTMLIGTLAIAGIPPLAGFFSKDEILFRTFLTSKVLWVVAALTALMTAFYMFRLMSLTFFGAYRGPRWEAAGGGHHADHGHGDDLGRGDAHGSSGHGHGAWHGPHEAPRSMTVPLMVLAVGTAVAGFAGVPAALGGGNAIEKFLEPSFAAHAAADPHAGGQASRLSEATTEAVAHGGASAEGGPHMSAAGEIGLMAFSVLIGAIGILVAYRIYVRRPEIAERLAARWQAPHRVLANKYYVDELYGATFVRGTIASANGLWAFDRAVVDGAVNGSGWFTIFSSWLSHLIDKYIVDGLVNLAGSMIHEASFVFRRLQSGLIQNYALLMLFGVFAFVSVYLLFR